MRYSRLPLKAKTKFHINQVQVEICCLNILISQGCRRVNDLGAEINHIETLEARRTKQIRILKSVQIQDAALRHKTKSWKAAFAHPLPVEPLRLEPELIEHNIDFEEINRTNTVAAGPFSTINQSETLGRALCTPDSPINSRESSVNPGAVFVDMQANAMFTKFVNNATKLSPFFATKGLHPRISFDIVELSDASTCKRIF